ncbi:MAG: ATPase, T2SS/T4P/T4SS family, partial [Candidatus Ratteibacteria bacterium]|nr:ATPase, T2SS/T4P/T4SS family [Candidatus Ratteibacteria bacterium]
MVRSLRKRLNEILIEGEIISTEQLKKALEVQDKEGGRLGQILVKLGFITEKDLIACLSQHLNIPPINLNRYKISAEVLKIIPEHVSRHYQLIPVSLVGKTLTVAMADPLNIFAMDDIKVMTGYNIDPIITTSEEILEAISKYHAPWGTMEDAVKAVDLKVTVPASTAKEELDLDRLRKEVEEAPVIKIVNLILGEGVKKKASDIHIEPFEDALRVRYCIDGVLYESTPPPKQLRAAIISRLKILSRLDIAERRLPQDGQFKIRASGREIDFRVAIIPTMFGERVTLRILDKSALSLDLSKLGFSEEPFKAFSEAITHPHGIILVTGPTGSGKTTSLYSALNRINTPEKNILTIEDPVEYILDGVNQIQINPDIGLTFASGLRSILRQAPNIILVGEIRDNETADVAIKSGLTGHLVFSTLHTNDAVGAVTRLIDMQIEPFLIASSLICILAQRLARKLCPDCRESYKVSPEITDKYGLKSKEGGKDLILYRPHGCPRCNNSGYRGRFAVVEAFSFFDEIKNMIVQRASETEIKEKVTEKEMVPLRESGLRRVVDGTTSLEEILRVTA